jgi:hypothetical protein
MSICDSLARTLRKSEPDCLYRVFSITFNWPQNHSQTTVIDLNIFTSQLTITDSLIVGLLVTSMHVGKSCDEKKGFFRIDHHS